MSKLPNIRRMIVPLPGNTYWDLDLDSADLRTVTWESDCKELKAMFAEKRKPYVEMGREYYHDPSFSKQHPQYTNFKSLCHGTNYLGQANNLAGRVGLGVSDCERVQKWYLGKCPEIPKWHSRIKRQMDTTGTVSNAFGYRRKFLGRIEGTIYNEAVAWIGQSTTSICINKGFVALDEFEEREQWGILIRMQVHDSLAGEFPTESAERCKETIRRLCSITVPYPDPFIMPIGLKTSTESWGDCE